ncbi:MAG: sulfotransferase family protein [Promethearchaeota archaeon]
MNINPNVSKLWRSLFLDESKPNISKIWWGILKVKILLPETPIIIGGCGRSGTTLLHSILSSHPKIYAIPSETTVFCPTAYGHLQKPLDISKINFNAPFDMKSFYGKCFNQKIPWHCNRWCEKTPRNVLFFKRILEYFGKHIKLINIVRDGRDVILSTHPSNPQKFWINPERWINDVAAGLKFINHPQVFTLRYEDLVLNSKKTIKEMCEFLDINSCQEILDWHKYATYRKDPSLIGEINKLHPESINKWKKPEWKNPRNQERIANFMKNPQAIKLLQKFGYEI